MNNQPAPQVDVDAIPNAIPMGLDSDIQVAEMPAGMNGSMSQPMPSVPSVQSVPAYPQVALYPAQPVLMTPPANACQVVRLANGSPDYTQIQKGCYREANYTVGKGDTIFLVAYLVGKSVDEIAQLNQMNQPYQLKIGQVLRVQ
ncbi:hypothetical protein A4A71_08370 [Nicoletella semolina]|nr:hypothetical protein [Nicoletella semolina]